MNSIEISLVFLEGLALIASPCILPILPLVLSASIEGGRRRPYGIIIGFIVSFSLFALLASQLVNLLGINLDLIKQISLVFLALFGIVLLSTTLTEKFNQSFNGLATLSQEIVSKGKDGFISGIMIGSLIGLVWTPCAGPILAAVLVQIIRQQDSINSLLMIMAFSLGTAVPMLIIAVMGRSLVEKLGFLSKHASLVRKLLGVMILLSVFYIGFGMRLLSPPIINTSTSSSNVGTVRDGLFVHYPAPQIKGIEHWINSQPFRMEDLKGKVVLVDFWTYSCINCIRTLPYLTSWDKKYRDKGLVIVGVHSPEFEFEKKLSNVEAAVKRFGIEYPVLLDNTLETWGSFNNQYWPAHYLIDKEGRVVYTHFGEGNYDVTEQNIQALLKAKDMPLTPETLTPIRFGQTPETYLGYLRSQNFANNESLKREQSYNYVFPEDVPNNSWALQGTWNIQSQRIISESPQAAIRLHFTSNKVFLVMGSRTGNPIQITVLFNGKTIGNLTVADHKLYELISLPQYSNGIIDIIVTAPGLEAYAFTFGS